MGIAYKQKLLYLSAADTSDFYAKGSLLRMFDTELFAKEREKIDNQNDNIFPLKCYTVKGHFKGKGITYPISFSACKVLICNT